MTKEEAFCIIGNIPIPVDDESYTAPEYQQAKAIAIDCILKVVENEKGKEERRRIQHKRYYEKNKEKTISRIKERYNRLKEQKICPGCMEKIEDEYKYIKCEKCRKLQNMKRRMNYDTEKRKEKYRNDVKRTE